MPGLDGIILKPVSFWQHINSVNKDIIMQLAISYKLYKVIKLEKLAIK